MACTTNHAVGVGPGNTCSFAQIAGVASHSSHPNQVVTVPGPWLLQVELGSLRMLVKGLANLDYLTVHTHAGPRINVVLRPRDVGVAVRFARSAVNSAALTRLVV